MSISIYTESLFYFLANDEHVPGSVRNGLRERVSATTSFKIPGIGRISFMSAKQGA